MAKPNKGNMRPRGKLKPPSLPMVPRAPKRGHYYLAGLRRVRLQQEMTQARLSELSGISRPMISMIERLDQRGSPRTIPPLAQALNVNPQELLLDESLAEHELRRFVEGEKERDVDALAG